MEQSLVTIVVPVYNMEKYLDRCMKSIVEQTYPNLEILLIDDGSTDSSSQMCDAWAAQDNRIRVIHKQNEGLGMARNTGIDHANGDFICFFDSDDYVAVDTIEKALSLATKECADVVIFGVSDVNSRGEVIKRYIPESDAVSYRGASIPDVFLPSLIDRKNTQVKVKNLCFSAWSCLYAMELVRRVNWRFVSERQIISEDSYSLIWFYQHVRCVSVLNEALYFYCKNGSSLTRTYRKDRFEKIKYFYDACIEMSREAGYGETLVKPVSGLFFSLTIAAMKQIMNADISFLEKKRCIFDILNDATCEEAITYICKAEHTLMRKLLLLAMEKKLYLMVCLLLKMQIVREKIVK